MFVSAAKGATSSLFDGYAASFAALQCKSIALYLALIWQIRITKVMTESMSKIEKIHLMAQCSIVSSVVSVISFEVEVYAYSEKNTEFTCVVDSKEFKSMKVVSLLSTLGQKKDLGGITRDLFYLEKSLVIKPVSSSDVTFALVQIV